MTRGKTVELHIPSELGWERVAMDVAAGVATRMGFPPERVEDIRTAVSEATLNAIEHGNALNARKKVFIVLIPGDETLEINVRDRSSRGFVPGADLDVAPNLEEKSQRRPTPRA